MNLNDSAIPLSQEGIADLWFVRGLSTSAFPSKIIAESFARKYFPEESEEKRYMRVTFKRYFPEEMT